MQARSASAHTTTLRVFVAEADIISIRSSGAEYTAMITDTLLKDQVYFLSLPPGPGVKGESHASPHSTSPPWTF